MLEIFQWILINIVSPVLLPVFVIIVLCGIADIKPEPFVKLFIDIVQTVASVIIRLACRVLVKLASALLQLVLCLYGLVKQYLSSDKTTQAKKKKTSWCSFE